MQHLGQLNTTRFFHECGMVRRGEGEGWECPVCSRVGPGKGRVRSLPLPVLTLHEPLPLKILIAIGAALGFLVAAATYAVKRGWV